MIIRLQDFAFSAVWSGILLHDVFLKSVFYSLICTPWINVCHASVESGSSCFRVRHVGLQKHNLDSIKQRYTFYCAHVHQWWDVTLVINIAYQARKDMTLVHDELCDGGLGPVCPCAPDTDPHLRACTCTGVETKWRHGVCVCVCVCVVPNTATRQRSVETKLFCLL